MVHIRLCLSTKLGLNRYGRLVANEILVPIRPRQGTPIPGLVSGVDLDVFASRYTSGLDLKWVHSLNLS